MTQVLDTTKADDIALVIEEAQLDFSGDGLIPD